MLGQDIVQKGTMLSGSVSSEQSHGCSGATSQRSWANARLPEPLAHPASLAMAEWGPASAVPQSRCLSPLWGLRTTQPVWEVICCQAFLIYQANHGLSRFQNLWEAGRTDLWPNCVCIPSTKGCHWRLLKINAFIWSDLCFRELVDGSLEARS